MSETNSTPEGQPEAHDETTEATPAAMNPASAGASSDPYGSGPHESGPYESGTYGSPHSARSGWQGSSQSGPQSAQQGGQPAAKNFFDWLRGLGIVRGNDRWIGGVASGVAARLGIDPIIVRGVIVVASIFFGIGLLAYGVAWALLPEPDGRIHVQEVAKGTWSSGMTGASIFVLLAILPFWRGLLFFDSGWWFPWPLLVIAAIVTPMILAVSRGRKATPAAQSQPQGPSPYRPESPVSATHPAFSASASSVPVQPYQGSLQTSTTAATAPSSPTVLLAPTTQPKPKKPRAKGAGAAAVAITLGLAALVFGGIFLAELLGLVGGSVAVLAWASAGVVCALGIVVAALRGRTGSGLGFFAVTSLIVAGALALLPQVSSNAQWSVARTTSWSVDQQQEAQDGFVLMASSGALDLRPLKSPNQTVTIPILIAAASAKVQIPDNVPVEVRDKLWAGNVSAWIHNPDNTQVPGPALRLRTGSINSIRALQDPRLFLRSPVSAP